MMNKYLRYAYLICGITFTIIGIVFSLKTLYCIPEWKGICLLIALFSYSMAIEDFTKYGWGDEK